MSETQYRPWKVWMFLQMGPSLWWYFYTFHPEPVYFSRLFLAGYKEKSLCDHCAWLGHSRLESVAPVEILCGVPEQLWVERGATERSPLVCGACVRVLRSPSIAQLVLLVETCGAPGLGQGSRFMPPTEASFNFLQRRLRTGAALFMEPWTASLWPGAVQMGFFRLFLYWDI